MIEKARQILKKVYGYDNFRLEQENIIQCILEKKDVLAIMPTGGGKSICFQIPALIFNGLTIVVSPLIALMKDQVEALKGYNIPCAFLNSSLEPEEEKLVYQQLQKHQLKLLYISPERLLSDGFLNYVQNLPVAFVAIDEAHCVSVWGHDFRPEYQKLHRIRKLFPNVPFAGFTATADRATQEDIVKQLALTTPTQYLSSFERNNLSLSVKPAHQRVKAIINFVKERPNQAGIVYCLSRKGTEDLASKLRAQGYDASHYHAKMSMETRSEVQRKFLTDKTTIICATIAFGMGIDKSNVRWVIHYNLPKNLEGFYQEIGRAGRDGHSADTLLFYSYGDFITLKSFIDDSKGKEEFKKVQTNKLQRMMQYCEATSCRRNIILSYFGEHRTDNCGSCDNCKNPPRTIDGKIITQKALSAVFRTQQREGLSMISNILIGSQNQELLQKGYNTMKTWGVGKEYSAFLWQQYLLQLVMLGYLEVYYHEGSRLVNTEKGKDVLFQSKEVQLVDVNVTEEKKFKPAPKNTTFKDLESDTLFKKLKGTRMKLADENNVPPYIIFSDKTLYEMANEKPQFENELLNISGVGQVKMEKYGDDFLFTIRDYVKQTKQQKNHHAVENIFLTTYELYKQGLSPEEIGAKRKINPVTIYSHLCQLHEKGYNINLTQYVNDGETELIKHYITEKGSPESPKEIYEHYEQKLPYHKIRLALTLVN